MKKTVKITFGIPMYNAEPYIEELIKCFDENREGFYEILIVNDGSTDNSVEKCSKYKNIKIINKENGGVSSARNRIINEAKGEWIVFVDADDLIDIKKYFEIFNKFYYFNYDYCINVEDINLYKKLIKNKNKGAVLIEEQIINSPCNKFYKTKFLKENNIYFDENVSLGEDALFNIQCLYYAKNIFYFSDKIYTYRQVDEQSLTHKYRNNKYEELMYVNEHAKKFIKNYHEEKALQYIRVLNCRNCINDLIIFNEYFKTDEEKVKYLKKIKRGTNIKPMLFKNLKHNVKYYTFIFSTPKILLKYINKKIRKGEYKND